MKSPIYFQGSGAFKVNEHYLLLLLKLWASYFHLINDDQSSVQKFTASAHFFTLSLKKKKTNLIVFVQGNQQIDTNQLISPTKIKLTHLFIVFKVTKNISMIFFNKSKLSNYPVKF